MAVPEVQKPLAQETEHPYVVRVEGVCGGRPIIRDSRISIRQIAQLYKAGDSVEEMLQLYPQLNAAAVYNAISYYLDHQEEIEEEIAQNRLEALAAQHNFQTDEHGVFILKPGYSEIDELAGQITDALIKAGETEETMLQALREKREQS
jgi:uncharacterized protein (DUF433 family)